MKEWVEEYFKEQWTEVKDCNIDFEKYESISISNSLHVHERKYEIDGDTYRLLYAIGGASNTPLIQILER